MNKRRILIIFLVVFLLFDTGYSFFEYYYTPIDGDVAAGVVPAPDVQKILDDPFGFHLLMTGEKHVTPNRFFSHFALKEYLQNVPLFYLFIWYYYGDQRLIKEKRPLTMPIASLEYVL